LKVNGGELKCSEPFSREWQIPTFVRTIIL
jgi:hypothetical protein